MNEIILTSGELANPDFKKALDLLADKPFPANVSWSIAQLLEYVEEFLKSFQEQQVKILKNCNAENTGTGYRIQEDNPLFDSCIKELDALALIPQTLKIDLLTIPEKDFTGKDIAIEPIIFKALKKLLAKRKNTLQGATPPPPPPPPGA